MRILVAQAEPKVAKHVQNGLVAEGYAVDVVTNGNEAVWLAECNPYDALILEVMMPGKDGFTLVRDLRRKQINTPVVFLTSRFDVESRVQGLNVGGDDYMTKPFYMTELQARLRALMRRQHPQCSNVLRVADLELDLLEHKAVRAGSEIELTPREFALLELLMSTSPKPVSKTAIIESVWDQHFDSQTNVVNVFINRLREKIARRGRPQLIHTIRGVGFVLRENRSDTRPEPVVKEQTVLA